ncbi:hypothetical protein C5167_023267 [Papaver somniferum]|uniref:Uncharacterized protein n=1 Tax=Papaver somniferum TaxID=3469 RepID=A0A4Y7JNB4_PAPSO|nr:hypothetical protein C5167_023267 [Papaver somniferum]
MSGNHRKKKGVEKEKEKKIRENKVSGSGGGGYSSLHQKKMNILKIGTGLAIERVVLASKQSYGIPQTLKLLVIDDATKVPPKLVRCSSLLAEETTADTKFVLICESGPHMYLDAPIAEAVDHIINSAAKSNHMFVGQLSVPIALRGLKGAVVGVGAHHSQVLVESVTE